jgi:hypothetical protein
MKRYFTDGSTQWATNGESVVVKSTLSAEWSIAGSTVESLAKCDGVQETDENWQPLAKPEPIDDGGPAFPWEDMKDTSGEPRATAGMSLRDWFAGQALSGIMSNSGSFASMSDSQVAETSYSAADAMLAARKAKP